MMKKSSKGQGGEKHIFKSKVTIFNQILRIYIRKSLKLSVRIKDVISVGIRWGRKNADKMWLQGAGITPRTPQKQMMPGGHGEEY